MMKQEQKNETNEKPTAEKAPYVEAGSVGSTSRVKGAWRKIKLFFYYCSPCLLALVVTLGTNFQRVREVAGAVEAQVCPQLPSQSVSKSPDDVPPTKLQEIIAVVKSTGYSHCDQKSSLTDSTLTARQYISGKFLTAWFSNALSISTLSLLPFGILGVGLALKYNIGTQCDAEYLYFRKVSNKDFFLKYLVAFIIAMGWLYTFNPNGQAASAINDWLRNADIVSKDTSPNFFNLSESSIKHAIAAVFGWYLYLLGYFSYRFYKSDVLSSKIYNVLFKKFLFVIGVALIISSVGASSKESLLLIFLIGMFPLSAVTLLTEFGSKRLSMGEDQTSLSILPGISTWQILRLEEEGVDSVSSLATSDVAALERVISREVITPEMLKTWIDEARLITVVGAKRWTDINGVCETASEFVKKQGLNDEGFIAKLGEKNIFNADEISKTLKRTFNLKPE